eukprot:9915886-Prorocentrum_lima.AAC.1
MCSRALIVRRHHQIRDWLHRKATDVNVGSFTEQATPELPTPGAGKKPVRRLDNRLIYDNGLCVAVDVAI